MSLLRFHEQFGMFDITPVENIFIDELMLRAPGDFVKIYLYGLKLCYHGGADMDIPRMARDLGMEEENVRTAFLYWERQGIVRKVSENPEGYVFLNVKQELFSRSGGASVDDSLYQYRDFNNAMQEIYGSDRLLHPQDFQRIFDWIEVFGLEPEAVLILVKDVMRKKPRSTVNYLDKQAKYWAKNGIQTREQAEAYLTSQKASFEGAREILKHLRLNRFPTVDEEKLFIKWTEKWGFTVDAVRHCCASLNNIKSPNFAYIDKVLEENHKLGLHTVEEISGNTEYEDIKKLRFQMDIDRETYRKVKEMGFSEKSITSIGRLIAQRGSKNIADMESAARTLKKQGIMEPEGIEGFIEEWDKAKKAYADILGQIGETRQANPREVDYMQRWMKSITNMDLIALAIERAKTAQSPLSYANKQLKDWKEAGINTAEAAATYKKSESKPGKAVAEQNYRQREYTQEHWDSLLDDLFEEEK